MRRCGVPEPVYEEAAAALQADLRQDDRHGLLQRSQRLRGDDGAPGAATDGGIGRSAAIWRLVAERAALLAIGVALAVSCAGEPDRRVPADPKAAALERLHVFEEARRTTTDFRSLPSAAEAFGPDPVAVRRLPGTLFLVGLLRGRSVIVLLDEQLREIERHEAPASPTGLAVSPKGEVFVSGELSSDIARYALRDGELRQVGSISMSGVRSIRAIAYGQEGVLYVVEDHDHRLLTVSVDHGTVLAGAEEPIGLGPRTVLRTERHVVVNCVLSHTVVVLPVDGQGIPRRDGAARITHDGPFWAVDAKETRAGLLLAMGGVEDHPLDRRQGSFGYIDSFVYVYRVSGTPPSAGRLVALNASALGVVTPKAVALRSEGEDVRLRLTGYGDATLAELSWAPPRLTSKGMWQHPEVVTRRFVPGTVGPPLEGGTTLFADPLLDAWIVDDGIGPRVVPVPDPGHESSRSVASRVGEALFFTTLMAPWNRTKGSVSRFTCETCHFEGYIDGRIHHTGRANVRVTTKPLLGLFNNRPYFSRALDPDLTTMTHNEFRVAGLRSRHDPWFSLGVAQAPWLAYLGVGADPLSPEELRQALMVFFMEFNHRANPSVLGRSTWSAEERRGAEIFRDRCEGCHQARLVTDRVASRVPFDEWERLVMTARGPIVWARDTYEKTGVVPYVHESGTRVPSLRRLYKKRPYFTNGSAADLEDVLRRAGFSGGLFLHGGAADDTGKLDSASRTALLAFLDLL